MLGPRGTTKCVIDKLQGRVIELVTKFNRPSLLRNAPSENNFGSDRVDELPPEVARRAAVAFLVG